MSYYDLSLGARVQQSPLLSLEEEIHPAFYLAAFAVYNKFPRLLSVAFILAATIGQGSLVQTFAHMRTPIIMSYIRAIDGYLLGAAIGICVLIAFAIFYPYLQALQRRYLKHE